VNNQRAVRRVVGQGAPTSLSEASRSAIVVRKSWRARCTFGRHRRPNLVSYDVTRRVQLGTDASEALLRIG
jgi:hypothetical protein